MITIDDDRAYDAVEGLRQKGLVVRVDAAGSRVPKYRQEAPAKLQLNRYELVLLAELLLRGPQTIGELRGRASRMHHLDSLEIVQQMLGNLIGRPEPLVKQLPPMPGSRAERYVQLLCPEAHPLETSNNGASTTTALPAGSLSDRVGQLETELATVREAIKRIALSLGEPDPFQNPGASPKGDAK